MFKPQIKYGLLIVLLFQMGVIFYMHYAYKQLVANQESYYNNFRFISAKTQTQITQ